MGGLMQLLHRPVYAARLRELVRLITALLKPGDRVLDVGCGFGALGKALLESPACPDEVTVRGVERVKRSNELIQVDAYDGAQFPYENHSFDIVILADVLHHEPNPDHLMAECARVSRRLLIIKDHKVDGLLAQQRISIIDWAANAPYGVPCLYRYNTPAQWTESHRRNGLRIESECNSMNLYPPVVNLLFGRRLQYFVVLSASSAQINSE